MSQQNYTIDRVTNSTDVYGCTNFSTVQEGGEVASIIPNASFDASVTWTITASIGYVLPLANFSIPNATATTVTIGSDTYNVYQGGDLPTGVLGVSFVSSSVSVIICTIYLAPDSSLGISGTPYEMPLADTLLQIPISGCAVREAASILTTVTYQATGKNLTSSSPTNGDGITHTYVNVGSTRTYTFKNESSHTLPLSATRAVPNDLDNPVKLFVHTHTADSGYYFTEPPAYTIPLESRGNYFVTTSNINYHTDTTVPVRDKENKTTLTTINKKSSSKKITSLRSILWYTNPESVNSNNQESHAITMDYATAPIVSLTNELSTFNLNLIGNTSTDSEGRTNTEIMIPKEGSTLNFDFVGEANYPDSLPGFHMKVYDRFGNYYNFENNSWQNTEYILSKRTIAASTGVATYPLPKQISDTVTHATYGYDSDAYPSSINFPSLQTSHIVDTVNTSTTLFLSSEDINIQAGDVVSGSGVTTGTKVVSSSGTSVVLDKPLTATASDVSITFSKDYQKYYIGVAVNSGSTATTLGSSIPTYANPKEIIQYRNPKITIVCDSNSGQFTIPAGVTQEVPFNFDSPNGIVIDISATITPGAGKSTVNVSDAAPSTFSGEKNIVRDLVADAQQYKVSKHIYLDNTVGITPGMRVLSSANSSTLAVTWTGLHTLDSGAIVPMFTSTSLTPAPAVGDGFIDNTGTLSIPEGTTVVYAAVGAESQEFAISAPAAWIGGLEKEITYTIAFDLLSSQAKVDSQVVVESIEDAYNITLSEAVDLSLDDQLTFTSDNLEISRSSLTAVESGSNAVISGTVTLGKTSKRDTTIFINLDSVLTES